MTFATPKMIPLISEYVPEISRIVRVLLSTASETLLQRAQRALKARLGASVFEVARGSELSVAMRLTTLPIGYGDARRLSRYGGSLCSSYTYPDPQKTAEPLCNNKAQSPTMAILSGETECFYPTAQGTLPRILCHG
jgi:hypothetical protein